MRKIFSIIFGGMLFLLPACSDEKMLMNEEPECLTTTYFVSLEEAIDIAKIHFNNLYEPSTRGAELLVESVDVYNGTSLLTRSDNSSCFYVLNFAQDGFAVVSGDKRLNQVYAISDNGSLHLSDTVENKGLQWYVENIMDRDLAGLIPGIGGQYNPYPLDSVIYNVKNETLHFPMLTGFKSKFSQSSPYNKYCFTADGKQAVTGCAPLAFGTVMGFCRFPDKLEGYVFDWNAMDKDAGHDGWSRLFELVGRTNYLNTIYGTTSSSTYSSRYIPTLTKLGKNNCSLSSFNVDVVAQLLKDNKIIMVRGNSDNGGHIWIVDGGYIDNSGPATAYDAPKKYMLNCIWGWGGANNGYFYYRDESDYNNLSGYGNLQMLYGYM